MKKAKTKANTLAGDFPCKHGRKLKKIMGDARHDRRNIIKIGIGMKDDGKIGMTDAWGYDAENHRRQEMGENQPMSKDDCVAVCSNMMMPEAINFIKRECPEGDDPIHCRCKMQICDDVYETHGHGRLGEKIMQNLDKILTLAYPPSFFAVILDSRLKDCGNDEGKGDSR